MESPWNRLILEEIHSIVGHPEFFLKSPDEDGARIHFFPDSLLDVDFRFYQE